MGSGTRTSQRGSWDCPHPPAPSPIAMGEGEKLNWGRAKPSPGPRGCRGAAASQSLPNG